MAAPVPPAPARGVGRFPAPPAIPSGRLSAPAFHRAAHEAASSSRSCHLVAMPEAPACAASHRCVRVRARPLCPARSRGPCWSVLPLRRCRRGPGRRPGPHTTGAWPPRPPGPQCGPRCWQALLVSSLSVAARPPAPRALVRAPPVRVCVRGQACWTGAARTAARSLRHLLRAPSPDTAAFRALEAGLGAQRGAAPQAPIALCEGHRSWRGAGTPGRASGRPRVPPASAARLPLPSPAPGRGRLCSSRPGLGINFCGWICISFIIRTSFPLLAIGMVRCICSRLLPVFL